MSAGSQLHIIAPGICGPVAETVTIRNLRHISDWVRYLARSNKLPSSSDTGGVIASLFNLPVSGDFPSAAFSMLAGQQYDPSLNYMFADPVHMQADMDHALLTSSADLDIDEHEAATFCEVLNQHFNADGISFTRIDKDRWIVISEEAIELKTTPLSNAVGRNVNFILPEGAAARRWKQLLTEAQMLMHSHAINVARENAGCHTINSLWFHGAGRLPKAGSCNIDSVCSNDILFQGLAAHVQCEFMQLPHSVAEYINYLLHSDDEVNVLHLSSLEHLINYTDVGIWSQELAQILDLWIYPLLIMANKNNYNVVLYPCNGYQYQFSKFDAFKIWRHEKLEEHVSSY